MKSVNLTIIAAFAIVGGVPAVAQTEIVAHADINWEQLNPARGDQSPQAGTLWGDRKGPVPTGFLAKFVDGFSSPPHIHNATYRAVVISGMIHNNHPEAPATWMPPGSFWTQPVGQLHITAAKGENNVALVEIDQGPYLVQPPDQAYDNGERAINVDAANIVWVDLSGGAPSADHPQKAYLWGSLEPGQSNGTFIKLPAGFSGVIKTQASTFRAVVISGQLSHRDAPTKTLGPGSYFGSSKSSVHEITTASEETSILYLRTNQAYQIIP